MGRDVLQAAVEMPCEAVERASDLGTVSVVLLELTPAMQILAGLNVWFFHSRVYQRLPEWDALRITPPPARWAGLFSILLWAAIIVAGRMIAYNWFDCDIQPQPALINWAAGCVVQPK